MSDEDSDADRILAVFKRFDLNGDGVIQRSELGTILRAIDPDSWDDGALDSLLDAIDENGDGGVDYEEFVKWISSGGDGSSTAMDAGSPDKLLDAILSRSPHLDHNETCKEAKAALEEGDLDAAAMLVSRLLLQLESDSDKIDAAFLKFDHSGSGDLDSSEQRAMFDFLGWPDPEEDDDAKELLSKVDADGSGKVTKMEFKHFVEEFGGCAKLFALRRKRMLADRSTSTLEIDGLTPETLQEEMSAAGIDPDAQAYWELVLPPSELNEVVVLTECQKQAVYNIRNIAKVNHMKALGNLQQRVKKLGFKDMDLWTTLAWVRDLAPIIVHFWWDRMAQFLDGDTHYRSQFETGSSCGLNNRKVREKWEHSLFQGAYDGCKDFERPKYGVLNVHNDYRGVVRAKQYGDCYMVLKNVRLRTTFSPEDSANLKAERLACLDFYAHVLDEYTNDELQETLKVATTGRLGKSDTISDRGLKYKEAQFHGEVAFLKHVDRIVLPREKYEGQEDYIRRVCEKQGWQMSWMDEEQGRREALEAEHAEDAKITEWKEKLKAMAEGPKDPAKLAKIPEGFCIKGCGKHVAPGTTRSGNAYKTCCKGCALGFGHDLRCNLKDGQRVPCKKGCGMLGAPGFSRRGNPYDTCCRGCIKGIGHDARCKQDPIEDDD
eukprot:TRINITY_DN22993_c0_g1_i1.p1 TRINITY_DN22993_c0_g1~~TRINITY_DN22993_c0_g1_i1.p1  ORF type:complete len:660 (+),score=227.94 TRINITY_DN22993_c0_g1_i1:55-2034(+)